MKISATIQELGVYSTTTEFEFNRNPWMGCSRMVWC
jgi:hypothetical protein